GGPRAHRALPRGDGAHVGDPPPGPGEPRGVLPAGRARGRLLSAPPSPRPARPPSRRRRRRPPSPHGGGHGTRGRTTGAWPRRSPLTDSVLDRRGLERRLAFLHVHLEAHGP